FKRADFLHERSKRRFRRALLVWAEQLPLAEFNPVKEMEAMPTLFGNKRGFVFTHRASVSGERNGVKARCRQTGAFAGRGRWAMQYSSPSRATRNSRLGSLNSVAPHVAHLCSGSSSLRDWISKRWRRTATSFRCRKCWITPGPKKMR